MQLKLVIATAMGLGLAALAAAETEPRIRTVEGDLPGEAEFEALQGLEDLGDRDVVLLDINMLPLAWPTVMDREGKTVTPQACEFGMIDGVEKVSVPSGSNHLLVDVWLGNREDHAANGLSCEYSPVFEESAERWARMRLTGCYLVREVSIPTARQLVLNPLPASACGLAGQ